MGSIFESLAIPFQGIAGGLNDIFQKLGNIGDYLNPINENFILKKAFVPSEGFFTSYFNEIHQSLSVKFGVITQVHDLLTSITAIATGEHLPEFIVNFNNKYGKFSAKIIDFTFYADYRNLIYNFIRFTSWFFFLKGMLRRMPSRIYS